jgi:hypothetical protein
MNNLIDGIAKAYELGAGCLSAKVTIQIYESTNKGHSMRRLDENAGKTEIRYIPSKWDPT